MFFGEHAHVGRNAYINGIGDVEIGKDSLLNPNVVLITRNHTFYKLNIPIYMQGPRKAKIKIETQELMVTKDLASCSIATGVPAEITGNRRERGTLIS